MKQAVLVWSVALVLLACSNGTPKGGSGSGGSVAQGGAGGSSSGGTAGSGGGAATGGRSTGGMSSVGGVNATGGASPSGGATGGATTTGGRSSGGASSSGGATGGATGGRSTGGAISSGGATGGATTTGGRSSGGAISSGGATGGVTGGKNSGGASSSGGATGGATGGTSSGGALGSGGATGGATGGTSSGGAIGSGGATGGTAGAGSVPTIAGCNIFPADNPWNTDISGYSLDPNGPTYLANMSPTTAFHPDWGTVTEEYGIPFLTGTGATPQPMTWNEDWGATESDPLPCTTGSNQFCYPIPLNAPIEGGPTAATDSDRHVLYIDTAGAPNTCTLYELYNAQNPTGGSGWTASNGAIFHLGSDALRTDGWTSADAAGLPILPGLVRYDEVMAGEIRHAIRFTISQSQQGYIHPATHAASNSSDSSLPPMGLRLRLKASFATTSFSGPTLVILTAMKKYGIILADNGSNWYISGECNEGWDTYMDDLVSGLRKVHGSDFEVVDTGVVSTAGL